MRSSKRLLATLLTLCIMASFVFTGTAFAADEAAVTLTFPAQIVNVNGTASLSLTGATADSWESSDNAIATVKDGVVSGVSIGKVTITAKNGGEAIASIEIPVVGENLLVRNGVNHGAFEGGTGSLWDDSILARLRSTWSGKGPNGNRGYDCFWWTPLTTTYGESASVVTGASALDSNANILKYSNVNRTSPQFLIGTSVFKSENPDKDYGAICLDTNKLYEVTGWVKFDAPESAERKELPGGARVYYYDYIDHTVSGFGNKVLPNEAEGKMNLSTYSTGFTANDEWQLFNTAPKDLALYKNDVDTYMQLRIAGNLSNADTAKVWLGDFYVADLSFHEVSYDPVFKTNSSIENVKVGYYTSTKFEHLSNTGKVVSSFDENGNARTIPVTYDSANDAVATVDEKGYITAVGAGTAVITATATAGGQTVTRTITFDVEKDVVDAFTPDNTDSNADYNEPTVITITKDGVEGITSEPNGDGTHTITAPAEKINGSKFLYWAKGLTAQKKILLYKTNELTDYLPDGKYANYLIPVYEDDISAPEYYNANGQLIPGANQDDRVTMPGYGTSNGWQKYGENIYVATYALDKPAKNIVITTTNCTTDEAEYGYGDLVTCTPNGTEGIFKCWKKNGEIVSVDPTYTFKAWESCAVEAVYVDRNFQYTGSKMKIIIDSFKVDAETGVMAEFIGLGNAIEKGIMFTDKESGEKTNIAMTTKGSQFSVVADKAGTYVGYAILRNGDAYTLITDGEYIHN